MVSFSCENCGDVLTKKKLDTHRNQCRGASFTCLDCMVHFQGMDYRSHTSCISEAQKYQGVFFQGDSKGKKSKPGTKTVTIEQSALIPRKAYVEDAPDFDGAAVAIIDAPPHAPSPPPAVQPATEQATLPAVNVFDFLVTEDTPNASRITLAPEDSQLVTKEQMRMEERAPEVLEDESYHPENHYPQNGYDTRYDDDVDDYDYDDRSFRTAHDTYSDLHVYEGHGYSYGADPIPTYHQDRHTYLTPAPKRETERVKVKEGVLKKEKDAKEHKERKKDKKRKRHPVEELDLSALRPSSEPDALMTDAPAVLQHSGLTGGLNRLLSKSDFLPSPDYSGADAGVASPNSPLKRSKHTTTTGITKEKNRISTLTKTRKPSSSSQETETERRPRKHHRHHHHHHNHRSISPQTYHRKQLKTIEYHQPSNAAAQNGDDNALVLYRSRAELFLSFINKGPDSEKGLSVNKVLKRCHRERAAQGLGLVKLEEEKELWKGLRVRRNDRGEVVLFI